MELKKEMLRGTQLSESDFRAGKVITTDWKPELHYAWDNGVGIGYYLAQLKAGKITASFCNKCNRIMLPPRAFCELCFKPTDGWVDVLDTGTINTFSVSLVDWAARRIKKGERPHTPAVIEIDGASPGHGMLHLIGEIDPYEIKIGMRVKAVWKKPEERTGSITDILYFKPIREPKASRKK